MYFILFFLFFYSLYVLIPTLYFKVRQRILRKKKGNILYLTFDDGPSIYTEKLLDVLKKYSVKATFFCVASSIKKYPQIFKRIQEENHLIGLHSYSHENAHVMGLKKVKKDFQESSSIMHEFNTEITYYRPPWGDINLCSLFYILKNKYKLIYWDVLIEDWHSNTDVFTLEMKLLRKVQGGDIICLHDGRNGVSPKKLVEAIEKVLPILLKKGYKFETVDVYEKK